MANADNKTNEFYFSFVLFFGSGGAVFGVLFSLLFLFLHSFSRSCFFFFQKRAHTNLFGGGFPGW